jgi:hypothetical protein
MNVLLLARFEPGRGGLTAERQDDVYGTAQETWTVMRHFLGGATLPIRLLAGCVVPPSFTGLLVSATRLAKRCLPRHGRAAIGAIAVAPVADVAEKEDLAALVTATDDEAKRVHVPSADRQELDGRGEPCDEENVEPRPRGTA